MRVAGSTVIQDKPQIEAGKKSPGQRTERPRAWVLIIRRKSASDRGGGLSRPSPPAPAPSGIRTTAGDLLQYARIRTTLGDRIRVLAVLEQAGSVSVSNCLVLFCETSPMAGLASAVLNRTMDHDAELIGPGSCRNKSLLICNRTFEIYNSVTRKLPEAWFNFFGSYSTLLAYVRTGG